MSAQSLVEPPTRVDFLRARRTGIGGSDIAAILGLSRWSSPLDVYLAKRGEMAPTEDNEPMYWGRVLEDVVAREFVQRTGRRVQRVNAQMRHPEHPWMIANIDRAIPVEGSRARLDHAGRLLGASGVLEVKTASAFAADDWRGDDGSDSLPVYYAAQCMWYLGVTGLQACDVAALIGGQRYVHRVVERDDETIAALIEHGRRFWHDHVLAGKPPEPRNGEDVAKLFARDRGTYRVIDEEPQVLELVNDLRAARDTLAAAKERVDSLTDALKLVIGPDSGLEFNGRPAVTWRAAKDSQVTDWPEVAAECMTQLGLHDIDCKPIVARHTTTKPGSRRFIVK